MGSTGTVSIGTVWSLVITITLILTVEALHSLKDVQEGPCEGIQYKSQEDINMKWLASVQLPYVLAGSKYHMYRFVKYHHKVPLKEVSEYKFYYESCFRSYANVSAGHARIHGFNGELTAPYLLKPTSEKGVLEFVPTEIDNEVARHYLTLTDNKTYALFANCWLGPDQRSWVLVSTEESLSQGTLQMIEDHLVSLGFERQQFIFFNHCACEHFEAVA
ncbi:hypothetical protein Ocin01_15635 [Orchesella cincta]|uniref:Uncharacterized protein n=1 Tax=Orchesella cincta TaxID=48709 RepID=A0A1D2MDI5_ORCCI|nr:hypothetical protein Ocin01_15635 [Orchesella cincta]